MRSSLLQKDAPAGSSVDIGPGPVPVSS